MDVQRLCAPGREWKEYRSRKSLKSEEETTVGNKMQKKARRDGHGLVQAKENCQKESCLRFEDLR